ncbi:MAG: adenylate/guanylate cyclase domain-containing protein [Gammaproteobacteria bacterium]|nr:adenylate/guanylate cyclase domain-containing protein [Gammaproteobacteria bacterium]
MDKTQQNYAVMFADIAGSTRLYERLGDHIANQMISGAMKLVAALIKNNKGVVVKHIGDEVMCRFSSADHAVKCACEIHEMMELQPVQHGIGLVFRIGINWGPAILREDGDIFGDAVNLAARMAGLAKARQIITTETVKQRLTSIELLPKCREIDCTHVKGKVDAISVIEVMWEPNNVTHMSTIISNNVAFTNDSKPLCLYYQQKKLELISGSEAYTFGRDISCDQMIVSTLASRIHAKIEYRRGKFVLVDESTNGTYLQVHNNSPIFLRREEVILQGEGVISFGEKININSDFLLRFSL